MRNIKYQYYLERHHQTFLKQVDSKLEMQGPDILQEDDNLLEVENDPVCELSKLKVEFSELQKETRIIEIELENRTQNLSKLMQG